ncbi:MAG: phospho-N-acetylmuramoyl-pentapeptide-transferase [Chloroflexota bacterium]
MSYSLTLGTISFLIAVIWGKPLINTLKRFKIGQQIRVDGPSTHLSKAGTPTMGGILIVVPVLIITGTLNIANLLGFNLIGRSILVPMGVMLFFGILGVIDDYSTVASESRGLSARAKFAAQIVIATVATLVISLGDFQFANTVAIPRVLTPVELHPVIYSLIAIFIIVGASNAVNVTDGLDGLAGSTAAVAYAAYGVITFQQGQVWLVAFIFTVVGAILAFLWFNAYPAEMFMGEVGSGTLGATLAIIALMSGQWLLLPIVGFIFVAEILCVILQVAYFKMTKGKRLFKMSPLHNHFELSGWSQPQVTQRLWLVGILAGMLGIALALT